MAKPIRKQIPPARRLWSIVEMVKARYALDDEYLGAARFASETAQFAKGKRAVADVTPRTVRSDRANPDNVPLHRMFSYLSAVLTGSEIVAAIEQAIAEKEVDS